MDLSKDTKPNSKPKYSIIFSFEGEVGSKTAISYSKAKKQGRLGFDVYFKVFLGTLDIRINLWYDRISSIN